MLAIPYVFHVDSEYTNLYPKEIVWDYDNMHRNENPFAFDSNKIGTIRAFDNSAGTVTISMGETPDHIANAILSSKDFSEDAVTIFVTNTSVITASIGNHEMLVTKERFYQLLKAGYIGYLSTEQEKEEDDIIIGVFLDYNQDGMLLQLHEMPNA